EDLRPGDQADTRTHNQRGLWVPADEVHHAPDGGPLGLTRARGVRGSIFFAHVPAPVSTLRGLLKKMPPPRKPSLERQAFDVERRLSSWVMRTQRRPNVLFILGNHNHNTMLHKVARAFPEAEHWFTPYYCDRWSGLDVLRRLNLLEFIPLGNEFRRRCLA